MGRYYRATKYEIVKQLVGIEKSFTATRFTSFGSLYYADDVPKASGNEILCVNEDGTEMQCSPFAIGPTNNRMFFDDGRGTVPVDRGLCMKLSNSPPGRFYIADKPAIRAPLRITLWPQHIVRLHVSWHIKNSLGLKVVFMAPDNIDQLRRSNCRPYITT